MKKLLNPSEIDHAEIQCFAERAVWVAKLEETMGFLEDMVNDFVYGSLASDEDSEGEDKSGEHPYEIAHQIVSGVWEDTDRELEDDVAEWLSRDPEHWSIFRLVIFDRWWKSSGTWKKKTPPWVRCLSTNTVIAHYHHDPYGRQRTIDPELFTT